MAGLTPRDMLAEADIRASLAAHAAKWFPSECCALLIAGDAGAELVLADNLADKYHALDPDAYPRTGENAYILDPRLIASAERDGKRLVAIVHSHVRVGAYFSEEDIHQALSPFGDGPMYPGVAYVVLDAQEDGVRGYKTFDWHEAEGRFVEVDASEEPLTP